MMAAQQSTIQALVAEALETVRVNLQTPNQEVPALSPIQPDDAEGGPQAAETVPAAESQPQENRRKRRRI